MEGEPVKNRKRFLAFVLVLCTLIGLFAFPASAEEPTEMTISQLATAAGDVSASLEEIIQSGTRGSNGIYYNITAPTTITVGAYSMGIEDFTIMAARAVDRLGNGNAASTSIPYLNRTLGTQICTEAGTGSTLNKAQYLELADRISRLGTTSANFPTSFNRPTDGENFYDGRICVFSIAHLFANVLQSYASKGTLPASGEFLPTYYTTSDTYYVPTVNWYPWVVSAGTSYANYVERNRKVPSTNTVGSYSVSNPVFTYLACKTIVGLAEGKTSEELSRPSVSTAPDQSENMTAGSLPKSVYVEKCRATLDFISQNGHVPNYWSTSLGTIRYATYLYTLAKILRYYEINKALPASIDVQPWSAVTSSSGATISVKSLENTHNTGDCTKITISGASSSTILIDAGTNTAGVAIKSLVSGKTSVTIDHFIITHSHSDHIDGLRYLTSWADSGHKITVKNMYYNTVYFYDNPDAKAVLNSFVKNPYITVKNFYYVGYLNQPQSSVYDYFATNTTNTLHQNVSAMKYINNIYTISAGNYKISILPAIYKIDERAATDSLDYQDVNNSCLSIVCASTSELVKYVFPADLQGSALQAIANGAYKKSGANVDLSAYKKLYDGMGYSKVYYRASHHGKRSPDSYKSGNNFFNAEKDIFLLLKPHYIIGSAWEDMTTDVQYLAFKRLMTYLSQNYGLNITTKTAF